MFRQLLLENLAQKVFALALAVVLFVFVRQDDTVVVSTTVAIAVRPPDDKVLMSEPVDKVTITVEGKYSNIRKLDEKAAGRLLLHLTGEEGEQFAFEPEMFKAKVPPGVRVRTVRPAGMVLKFDLKVQRTVPVKALIQGEPDRGYRVTYPLLVEPANVLVEGAKSVVDKLEQIETMPIDLGGRTQSAVLDVPLAEPPRYAGYLIQRTYKVFLTIEEQQGTRAVSDRPVEVRGVPPDDIANLELSPQSVDLTLHGPVRILDALDVETLVAYVEAADIDPRKVLHSRPVRFDLPEGLSVVELKPKQVTLARRAPEPTKDAGVKQDAAQP